MLFFCVWSNEYVMKLQIWVVVNMDILLWLRVYGGKLRVCKLRAYEIYIREYDRYVVFNNFLFQELKISSQ